MECEIFTIIAALRDVCSDFHGRVSIFANCAPAIMCIAQIESEGESAAMWDALTRVFNRFSVVCVT